MTVDEALALVETVLDYDRLNRVQELVFRESWEGRSYTEIAKSSGYEADYLKDTGAKLWKLLSKALGEEVKKNNLQSVLKRYLRRTQVNSQRNLTIKVNLSGANLSGANLRGAGLFANLYEADWHSRNPGKTIVPDENTKSSRKIIPTEYEPNEEIQPNSEEGSLYWNGWRLRSPEEVKIAEALDRAGILFFPNSRARLTTPEGRQNQDFDFLICHEGKLGILGVWHQDATTEEERVSHSVEALQQLRLFKEHGIQIIQHYDASLCSEQPDRVVREFMEILSQAQR